MQKHSVITLELYKTIEPRLLEIQREQGPAIVGEILTELGTNLALKGQFILFALQKPDGSTVH